MTSVKRKIHIHRNGQVVRVWRILQNERAIESLDYSHASEIRFKGEVVTAYLNKDGEWMAFIPYPPISPSRRQAFDPFKGKYLTGLFCGLVLTYLLGCAAPQQKSEVIVFEQPIIGVDKAVRPAACEYLIGSGIEPGEYTDKDQDGIYEAQSEPVAYYENNFLVYSLTGDAEGNLLSVSVSLDINDASTVKRSKWELLGRFGKVYRTLIPDAEYVPLEIQAVVMREGVFGRYVWQPPFTGSLYRVIVQWVASMPDHQHDDAYTIFMTLTRGF